MGMRLIGEGAEARLYEAEMFGKQLVVKKRFAKPYRVKALDEQIRLSRTRREAKLMLLAYAKGIAVPAVVAYGKYTIYMQKIKGKLLKDMQHVEPALLEEAGKELAKLHQAGIAHGDFTPANLIANNGKLFVIDFGLAIPTKDIEEMALDVLLMKRSLGKEAYASFLKGYAAFEKSGMVLERLKQIELRGRYQQRTIANV